jgi:hypothetical protein
VSAPTCQCPIPKRIGARNAHRPILTLLAADSDTKLVQPSTLNVSRTCIELFKSEKDGMGMGLTFRVDVHARCWQLSSIVDVVGLEVLDG